MRSLLPTLCLTFFCLLHAHSGASQKNYSIHVAGTQHREQVNFEGRQQAVQVCGLEIGKSYQVWAIKPGCQASLKLADAADYANTFRFVATAACMNFVLEKTEGTVSCGQGAVWFSIACLSCKKKSQDPFEKLDLNSQLTTETLVNDIFVGGSCYEISNLNTIGEPEGRGSFQDGASSINLNSGIILSTGDIALADGPNNTNSAGANIGGPSTDPDLELMTGIGLYDVQGIEFDFYPTTNSVSFEYVFASEEYCEYVNQGVSDVFGFFISGPGINGGFTYNGQNIALVPNSSLFISIDNVNHLTNSTYFVPNQTNCGGLTNMTDIQFDGWTSVLNALVTVVPCEKYHIRLVIADVGDGIYDSAIFLGGGSFSAGGDPNLGQIVASTGPDTVYESCNDGAFLFRRNGGSNALPMTLELTVQPTSTAIAGVDYDPFPLTLVIPAGMDSILLPVNIIGDNLLEGTETLIVSVANSCVCSSLEFVLEIQDPPIVNIDLPDLQICSGNTATLTASPSGGIPGSSFSYLWENGHTGNSLTVAPAQNQTYSVTVTDNCGTTASALGQVEVLELPTATLVSGGGSSCLENPNNAHELVIEFSGAPNWLLEYSLDGQAQAPILVTSTPFSLLAGTPGIYSLTGVASETGNCPGTAFGEATIHIGGVANTVQTTQVTCAEMGTMSISTTGGTTPYDYTWSNGAANLPSANGLPVGNYYVTVTDANGCSAIAEGTITSVPTLTASAAASAVDCQNPNAGTISLSLNGGTAPYSFDWTNGIPNVQNPTNLGAGTYEVTITEAGGCTTTATATILQTSNPPISNAQAVGEIDCNHLSILVTGQGSTTGPNISYTWTGPNIIGSNNGIDVQVQEAGLYTILVENTATGCSSTASVLVWENMAPPVAFAEGSTLTCTETNTVINGFGSSSGSNFTYAWSGPGILFGGNTLTPTIGEAGIYTILVTDNSNGCTNFAEAQVIADTLSPLSLVAPPSPLTCTVDTVLLDGSNSSMGANFSYQWSQNGNPINGANGGTLAVDMPGNYSLLVTDINNGCSASALVTVMEDLQLPVVSASVNGEITCTNDTVVLAANTVGNAMNFSFSWSTLDGSFAGATDGATATADAAGMYEVQVTDLGNGCTATATTQVTQDTSLPEIILSVSGNLSCAETLVQLNANGSSQGPNITFEWTTPNGNFFVGQNTLNPAVDVEGTYFFTLYDANSNCENQASVTITLDNAAPSIALPTPPVLDCATVEAQLVTAIGNVPAGGAISFSWSSLDGQLTGPTDVQSPTVSAAGTYTLEVTNEDNGCTSAASVLVLEDVEVPIASIAPPDLLDCGNGSVELDASGSSTGNMFEYSWTSTTGSFVSSSTIQNPVVNAAGTYNLLVTNTMNHCSAFQQVSVGASTELPDATAIPQVTLDCLNPELSLNGSGSSTGPSYSYEWTGPGVLQGGNTLYPLVDEPGSYQLLVTNTSNGCTAIAVVAVGADLSSPIAEAGNTAEISCAATSLTLDGSGSSAGSNFTYNWSTPNGIINSGGSTLMPTISAPGDYSLLVTNQSNGCTAADLVQITQSNDLPIVAIATAPAITCTTVDVMLDGTGSSNGPNFTYLWSTLDGNILSGETGLFPVVTEPGLYSLTVTNQAGNCSNVANVTVAGETVAPNVEAGASSELNCTVISINLNGSGSSAGTDYSYLWSTVDGNILANENSLMPLVDAPGEYVLLVTNNLTGCTSTDQVTVTENVNLPTAVAVTPSDLDCVVQSLVLSGTGSSTGAAITYEWSTLDGNILAGNTTLYPTVDEPGTYLLTVLNTANDCVQTAEVVVVQNVEQPTAMAGMDVELTCTANYLALNGSGSSLGNEFSYLWTTSNGNILNGHQTLSPTVNEMGTYLLTVTNSINGCTSTDVVEVTLDNSQPQVSILQPGILTCSVTGLELIATTLQGVNLIPNWKTIGGSIVAGGNTMLAQINAPGIYILTVTNTENGCSNTAQTTVIQDISVPSADAGQPFLMNCTSDWDYLDGSNSFGPGPLFYQWTTVDGQLVAGQNSQNPTIGQPGTYTLTVTNQTNGCTNTDAVTVSQEGPTGAPIVAQPPCFGESGTINFQNVAGGESPYLYSIDGGTSFSTQPLFSNLEAGNYLAMVQDANGCTLEATVTILEPVLLTVGLEPQITISLGDSFQITTVVNVAEDQITQVTWSPDTYLSCSNCLNPVATPLFTTSYTVSITTNNGCEAAANLQLLVEKSSNIYVPNAFSPNGDGINDVFMIYSDPKRLVEVKKFMVFDRWGESVFEYFNFLPNDPTYGWNGIFQGEAMDPAVFVWFAEVKYIDGRVEILKGGVTLVN